MNCLEGKRRAFPLGGSASPLPCWRLIIRVLPPLLFAGGASMVRAAEAPDFSVPSEWRDNAAPLIEAVEDYRRTIGLWPQTLDDLTSTSPRPADRGWTYEWRPDGRCVLSNKFWANQSRDSREVNGAAYVFGSREAGWYVRIRGQYFPSDVVQRRYRPLRQPSDEQVARAVSEFDRRITADPESSLQHQAKCSWLYLAERLEEGRKAAVKWIEAKPHELDARIALYVIERKRRTGLSFDEYPEDWAHRTHRTFAEWRLYNHPDQNTEHADRLPGALALPLAADQAEWYIAEVALIDHLQNRCEYSDEASCRRVIEIANRWEAATARFKSPIDRSYLMLRGWAYLRLGDFEAARRDTDRAIEAQRRGQLWIGHATELLHAIENGRRTFEFHEDMRFSLHGATWLFDSE